MNPETNRFEPLTEATEEQRKLLEKMTASFVEPRTLLRPNGEPVPKHWITLSPGKLVEVEGYTFKVAHIGEQYVVLEPHGPVVLKRNHK